MTSKDNSISVRVRIIEAFREVMAKGLTCDAVEHKLSLTHQTASSCVHYLVKNCVLVYAGRRDLTRSGRRAMVYVLAEFVDSQQPERQLKEDYEPTTAKSVRFWKSLKAQLVGYLKVRLVELPEHQRQLFKMELISDVDALMKRWGMRLVREKRALIESNRIRRGAINEACRALGLETPQMGNVVDIEQARKRKHEIALANHPDVATSPNEGLLESAVQAFKVIEKYNEQVKGDR